MKGSIALVGVLIGIVGLAVYSTDPNNRVYQLLGGLIAFIGALLVIGSFEKELNRLGQYLNDRVINRFGLLLAFIGAITLLAVLVIFDGTVANNVYAMIASGVGLLLLLLGIKGVFS